MDESELGGDESAVLRGFSTSQLQFDLDHPKTLTQRVFARLVDCRGAAGAERRRVKTMETDFTVDERQIRHALRQIRVQADAYFGPGGDGAGWLNRFEIQSRSRGRPSGRDSPEVNALVFRANMQPGWAARKFLAPMMPTPGESPGPGALLVHSETLALFDTEKQRFLWDSSLCSEESLAAGDDADELLALFRRWRASGRLTFRERPGFDTEAALRSTIAGALSRAGVAVEHQSGSEMRLAPHYERRHVILFGSPESNKAMARLDPPVRKRPDDPVGSARRHYDVSMEVIRTRIDDELTITAIHARHPAAFAALDELLRDEERFRSVCLDMRIEEQDRLPGEFRFELSTTVNDRHEIVGRGVPAVSGLQGFPTAAKKTAARVLELPPAPSLKKQG
ncbi:MAG: hypothetical protein R2762_24330 [Bryobacteraceae bacterium]